LHIGAASVIVATVDFYGSLPKRNDPMLDTYTIRHLDAWLDREISGDKLRGMVRDAMIAFISDDPEYWGSQSWWNVYDRARCDRIVLEV
jgi:hypothetical protein